MKKTVLITGASGNLGKACVEKFMAEGYRVIAVDAPGKGLKLPGNENLITIDADLMDEKSARDAVGKIVSKFKNLDAALLLVGGFAMGGIEETDSAALKKMYALNFEAAYFVARPVFGQMMKQPGGGRIIFVGARPALKPADGKKMIAYALSKSLVFKLSEILNAEGSSKNVTTAVVVPSTIDTPTNRDSMPKVDFSTWVKPEEIAETMAFLCSDSGRQLREAVVKIYGKA